MSNKTKNNNTIAELIPTEADAIGVMKLKLTPEPPAEPRKKAICLMGRAALMACVAARPELKNILKGRDVTPRRLGDGDKKILPLNQQEDLDEDTLIIGFSIPTNIIAKCEKGIEIPVGRNVNRQEISNQHLDNPKVEALIKALADTGRIALRAYRVHIAPLAEYEEPEHDVDAEIDSIQF